MDCFCCYRPITVFILLIFSLSYLLPFALAGYIEVDNENHFSYAEGDKKGPNEWGHIKPDWNLCETGRHQSPIDLLAGKLKIFPNLGKLKRFYKAAPAVVKNRGHDITVRWTGDAGKVNIEGTDYKLMQCHWHSPSEHTFNGTRHALELHLVHRSAQKKVAVIAILYKYGRPDPFLTMLLPRIKTIKNKEKKLGIVDPGIIKFGSRKYFRYVGSLTVPPCTEGVTWTIINKVRTVSREQVMALRDAVHDGFEQNDRPIQKLDDREIMFFTPATGS